MTAVESRTTENRFVTWTDWAGYLKILEAFEDRPIRVTYDRGKLEIMSPSRKHEHLKKLLGHMVECWMVEKAIRFGLGGSTTFKREDLDRGLEPDECYWIAHHRDIAGVEKWDPAMHPPPDLVIEAEVSRSVMDRMAIYGALGVPEIWRLRADGSVQVYRLVAGGRYEPRETSEVLPDLPLEVVNRHLQMAGLHDDGQVLRSFRDGVRAQGG